MSKWNYLYRSWSSLPGSSVIGMIQARTRKPRPSYTALTYMLAAATADLRIGANIINQTVPSGNEKWHAWPRRSALVFVTKTESFAEWAMCVISDKRNERCPFYRAKSQPASRFIWTCSSEVRHYSTYAALFAILCTSRSTFRCQPMHIVRYESFITSYGATYYHYYKNT